MLPCMNYCPECRKFSMRILTYYHGKMMCNSCKERKEREERNDKLRKR